MQSKKPIRIVITVILLLATVTMVLPLLWMISSSMKPEADVFKFPIEWIPKRLNVIENYTKVFSGEFKFLASFFNSFKISISVTILQLIIASMGAFAFSKLEFKFKKTIFSLMIATMMIPEQVTLVPRFVIIKQLNLMDSHLGLILMSAFSVYGVFLLTQNMKSIPDTIIEACKIDGAGYLRIFAQIVVPLAQPALVTLGILRFIWTWNDYQNPLIFINTKTLYTVQLSMAQFSSQTGVMYSLLMAASVVSTIPLIIIFIFGQNVIIDGISAGAVKG